jgi:hypothetical protein
MAANTEGELYALGNKAITRDSRQPRKGEEDEKAYDNFSAYCVGNRIDGNCLFKFRQGSEQNQEDSFGNAFSRRLDQASCGILDSMDSTANDGSFNRLSAYF